MNRIFNDSVSQRHSAAFARLGLPKASRSPDPDPGPVSPGSFFPPGFTRHRTRRDSKDENTPSGDHLVFTVSGTWYPPEIHISHTIAHSRVVRFTVPEYIQESLGVAQAQAPFFPGIDRAGIRRRVPRGRTVFG